MPKKATPLTAIQVKNAKARVKDYKLSDGDGMHLLVTKTGSKLWRLSYRWDEKQQSLAFGKYPEVSLSDARELRLAARSDIAAGINPSQTKLIKKLGLSEDSANTFETVAREWHTNKLASWQPSTAKNALHRLEKDIFPVIGSIPIKEITAPIMLETLRKVERRGSVDMAKRLSQWCGQIFRYAIAAGKATNDPAAALKGALQPRQKGHHASITTDDLPAFLAAFEDIEGKMYITTKTMFRLMLLTFVRTSELTETKWSEIDLVKEDWVIPWKRMKMGKKKLNPRKQDHHVFLPRQGWKLLRELHKVTGNNNFVFPSVRDHEEPAGNWGILAALKRMGYKGVMTGHGFRSLAMGVIKERLGYRHEVVDRQLSHASGDTYGEAYDRAQFKEERKTMMQDYADYIDKVTKQNREDREAA